MVIQLETAKLAKEKGFDVPCLAFYDSDKLDNQEGNDLTNYNSNYWNRKNNHANDLLDNQWTSAPTQSELQTWLRDVHQICTSVIPRRPHSDYKGAIMYQGVNLYKDEDGYVNPISLPIFNKLYKTHEEAMELELIKGLNKIKV